MNKKYICKALSAMVLCSFLFTGCQKKETKDRNYFDGMEEIENGERLNGRSAIYDDENIYFSSYQNNYYVLDKKGQLYVNCNVASCSHNDSSCEAYLNGEYFVFHGKLYKAYNDAQIDSGEIIEEGYIVDCETEKVVFDNPIPEELDTDVIVDDSTMIFYVRVLNEDVLKVEGHRHAYLLNQNLDVIYWHDGIGRFPWSTIYENQYYYVNDLYQLISVNLDTKEGQVVELEGKVFACDNEGDYIYYSNEFQELYRYSLKEKTSVKLAENVLLFSVHDGYIYYNDLIEEKKKIIDTDGTFIADFEEAKWMGTDCLIEIGDKLYSIFDEGVAAMNPDGSGYEEFYLSD